MKSLINIKDYRNEKIDIEIKINELKENFNGMSIEINKKKKLQQLEQVVKLSTYPSQHFNSFCYDDDDDEEFSIPVSEIYKSSLTAITPNSPITDSLIMEDEHLDTILKTESDKEYKSSVEDLNLTPSESEDLSDIESKCDVPVCDDFTTSSNPLFDSYDDSTSSDDESYSDEDSNDPPSFPKIESFHFDVLSSPRPPVKPPDDRIYFEPDMGLLTAKVVGDISKHYVLMPRLLPTQPTLYPVIDTLLPFSSEKEIKIAPDYEDPRARGFVHRSLELQSFA
ncbi:hypothetical protein Tco_1549170 [Tanacetum coccineum]